MGNAGWGHPAYKGKQVLVWAVVFKCGRGEGTHERPHLNATGAFGLRTGGCGGAQLMFVKSW